MTATERLILLTAVCVTAVALVWLATTPPLDDTVATERATTTSTTGPPATFADRRPTPAPTTTSTTANPGPSTTSVETTTTEAPATTAPAPGMDAAGCGGWETVIADHFPDEVERACRVFIRCESGGDPFAVSHTGDFGLAQINASTWNRPGHHDPVADWIGHNWHNVHDPDTNLQMARMIRDAYGWSEWVCQ